MTPSKLAVCIAIVLGVSAPGVLMAQERGLVVRLDSSVVLEGQGITGLVSTSAGVDTVRISWVDPFGDTFFSTTVAASVRRPGRFMFRVGEVVTPMGSVEAGGVGGRGSAAFTVIPKEDTFWNGFVVIADKVPTLSQANALGSRALGVTAALCRGRDACLAAGKAGLRPIACGLVSPGTFSISQDAFARAREQYEKSGDTKALVREVSLSDPAEISRLRTEAGLQARALRVFAPAGYVVAESPSVTRGGEVLDFSFAEADLAGFRLLVSRRIPSPGDVSRLWGETFRDYSQVSPRTARETKSAVLQDKDKLVCLAPWALHREYMDGRLAATVEAVCQGAPIAVRAAGSQDVNWSVVKPLTGLTGAMAPSAYGGHDWTFLSGVCDFVVLSPEAPEWSWALVRDINRSARVLVRVDAADPDAPGKIWRAASEGMAGVVLDNYPAFLEKAVSRQQSPKAARLTAAAGTPPADPVTDALKGLRGVADVVSQAERDAWVAIVYSPASVRAGWMMDYIAGKDIGGVSATSGTGALEAWSNILSDLGVDYQWVSARQVMSGVLLRRKFGMVVLPETWCLSPATVRALGAYAQSGGVVVADNAAGLLDETCTAYETPPADALFGIKRQGLVGARVGLLAPGVPRTARGTVVADATLQASGALAGGKSQAGLVEIVNSVGSGRTVYLNTFVEGYRTENPVLKAAAKATVERALHYARYTPSARMQQVSKALPARVRTYRYGSTRIVLADPVRATQGFLAKIPVAVAVDRAIRQPAYAYNLRSAAGPVAVAQTTAALTDLPVEVDFDGRTLYVRATLAMRAPAGDRLFGIELLDPLGRLVPQLGRRVVAERGSSQVSIAMPLNAAAGTWRVLVRDLATGMASWADVVIR
ncbi:MAG: hypothetical protein J7M19_07570 [Planctomycetes bacterium]|nr:hypothetical protein [Planctomycetota bacterium]